MNPSASRVARNPCRLAAASSHAARWRGCRHVVAAWSSSVGSPVSSRGRHSSTGGVSAGSPSARDDGVGDLDAAGRLRVGGRRTDHLDRRLLRRQRLAVLDHDLREAGAVADDQERERRELAAAVHPALQPDRLAGGGVRELAGGGAAGVVTGGLVLM